MYDVVVIGSGPAGLFAAMELTKNKNLNILVLEKARRLNDSRNVSLGWLGGSARSSIKMFTQERFGGEVATKKLIDQFLNRMKNYGSGSLLPSKKRLPKKLIKRANDLGFEVEEPNTISYSEEKMIKLGDFLYHDLREKATVVHKINILSIIKERGCFSIQTEETTYKAKKCILALGRGGASWLLENHPNLEVSHTQDYFDFGVRLEFPAQAIKEFTDKNPNFRLKYQTQNGLFKTSVPILYGTVETEEIGSIRSSNARSWGASKGHYATISVMNRFVSSKAFQDVYRLSEIVNVISDELLLKDSLNKILKNENMIGELKEFVNVIQGVKELSRLFPDIHKKCTIYGPEARLNALKFKVTPFMETTLKGLYIVGDMSGHTGSFVQAACSGLAAANGILKG